MSKKKRPRGVASPPGPGPSDPPGERGKVPLFQRNITAVLLLSTVIFLLYFNSLRNDFTNWDDQMIYANPSIKSLGWKNVIALFTLKKGSTYQPIRVLSYAIDYSVWGLDPMGYRIANILLYLLTCITLFYATQRLLKNCLDVPSLSQYRIALWTSLLYAAHPVHVEAVTWLAARKEVLHGFFFFLSFYLYIRYREISDEKRHWGILGGVLLTFVLAVLSKPSAVVLPAVFVLYELTRQKDGKRSDGLGKHWPFLAVSSGISVLFLFILVKVFIESGQVKAFYGGSLGSNLLLPFYLIPYNLKLLAFTKDYAASYTVTASFSLGSSWTIGAIGITLALFWVSLWSRKRMKILFFSFFFFFITLFLYLNVIPISTLLADRYVFLASFGYCLFLGFLLHRLYERKWKEGASPFFKGVALALFFLLLSGYACLTIEQNKVWKNSLTLWSDAVKKYPMGNLANAMMGVVSMDGGRYGEAVQYLERAVHIHPYDGFSRNNLAVTYSKLGQAEKALREFGTALRLHPEDETAWLNLAIFYIDQKDYQKSEEILRRLLKRPTHQAAAHLHLGRLLKEKGQSREAIAEFETSIRLNPQSPTPYIQLGNLYREVFGEPATAVLYYSEALQRMRKADPTRDELQRIIERLKPFSSGPRAGGKGGGIP